MDDDLEQPALPDSEAAGNTAAEDDQVAGRHDADQTDEDSQEQTDEEEEEIEVGDRKFALPKSAAEKLKAERLMHADYTQKTQATAERNRQLDARDADFSKRQQEAQQHIEDIAEVRSIDKQLAEYRKLDWDAYIEQDPVGAMKLQQQQKALEAQRNEVAGKITQTQQANALAEQQNLAKQVQEADAYFKREIPGWSNERSTRLQQYAITEGVPADALFQLVVKHPALAKALHKAELFDQLEKKQATAKPKPPVQEKPVTRITAARGSAQRDPDKMPMGEWADWFAKQRKK